MNDESITLYVPIYKAIQHDRPFILGSEYLSHDRAFEVGTRSKEFIKVIPIVVTNIELDNVGSSYE